MARIGRECEKWRYDFEDAACARAHALSSIPGFEKAGAPEPQASSLPMTQSELITWTRREGFSQVDPHILEPSQWVVCWARRLDFEENVLASEARAWLWSLRHQLRAAAGFKRRLLQLVDTKPLCLSANKGRASSPHLTRALQRGAALLLVWFLSSTSMGAI